VGLGSRSHRVAEPAQQKRVELDKRHPIIHAEALRTVDSFAVTNIVAGLALAITFGGMTFFSGVMTPLVFSKLPLKTAGPFVRQVFPWYYLVMGVTALIALAALQFGAGLSASWDVALAALVLAGFAFARQVLMPMINRARDAEMAGVLGASRRFRRLHMLSVVINTLQWLAVLVLLIKVLL
jgi:hypothetical protein